VGYTPSLASSVWVGYPNALKEMRSVHGVSVAGGTFPAAIWGEYMSSIKGSFCNDFKPPREPFVSSPFVGDYASNGGNRLGLSEEPDETEEEEPEEPEPSDEESTPDEGGAEFDPEQYESPPQDAPATETPPETPGGADQAPGNEP
jgi:penicillin-binding protein 1A